MKHVLIVSLLVLSTSSAFARRCVPDADGNRKFQNVCEVVVTGTTLSECHVTGPSRYSPDYRGNYPGNYPGQYNPPYHTHPWNRVVTDEESSACDINLEDCKYFAFRQLEKYKYTNNCGAVSVGKSVEYRYQSLNNDGTVADEVSGRMRR
jgi:hypothetical protein